MDKTLLILAYGSKAESTTEVIYSEEVHSMSKTGKFYGIGLDRVGSLWVKL